jgi:hypothetical protein
MRAIVLPHRIEIQGARLLPHDTWENLLDELEVDHIPSFTPNGKRMSIEINPNGRMDAFIYRTKPMTEDHIIQILGKYDIVASVGSVDAASA